MGVNALHALGYCSLRLHPGRPHLHAHQLRCPEVKNEAGITNALWKKVIGYYECLWQRNKGKSVTDLFDELPLAFQAELSLETYRNMIKKSSLFHGAPEEFMQMLSLIVNHTLYLPSQVIINKGDIGHHMYFISKGEVEINLVCSVP